MTSTVIISPQHNQNIHGANKDFNVVIAISNLATGQFTNPQNTYYSAPQQLNGAGVILGHSHITIQVRKLISTKTLQVPRRDLHCSERSLLMVESGRVIESNFTLRSNNFRLLQGRQ